MSTDPESFILRETAISATALVPEIRLHLADAALPLWSATEAELEQIGLPPPYWAFAWPGGQALARIILDRPTLVSGRSVIDFGAGSGIAALAAAKAGAALVEAAEIDPFALAALRLNAALNALSIAVVADPALLDKDTQADVLLIGDMCYERPLAEAVTQWARRAAKSGRLVLMGDPGRNYRPTDGLLEMARYVVQTDLDLEDKTSRETVVWRVLG